ncbi:DUF488 domain-containing protein [Paracoccus sp. 11-3]|uniref:DUF488 domain-containing protein n=1 Tax=Paracoccus amoyensis TaxID=2760093 RepID=A0A926JCZ4_9RHOB|nr:DUF488 domain-containing protein [Paracoccus amoyensis]
MALKRAYEAASPDDGLRILVDRLWPRGVSKEKADLDDWMKDIAPSTALRKWFNHDPAKWAEFRQRYKTELAQHPEQMAKLRELAQKQKVTLIFGARDTEHNEAVVLKDVLTAT